MADVVFHLFCLSIHYIWATGYIMESFCWKEEQIVYEQFLSFRYVVLFWASVIYLLNQLLDVDFGIKLPLYIFVRPFVVSFLKFMRIAPHWCLLLFEILVGKNSKKSIGF